MTPTAAPRLSSTLHSLFAYKAWANEELFGALATLDAAAHPGPAHAALRILNHVYVVDRIFQAHLSGTGHGYRASNSEEMPSLHALAAAVEEVDAWYIRYVAHLSAASAQEQVRFVFTDGDSGRMSREEMLMHVITHGGYHRGAAGQIAQSASVAPPRDLYTRFLHAAEPERRR